MAAAIPFILAGKPIRRRASDAVTNKYNGRVIARVSLASQADAITAIRAGIAAVDGARALAGYQRAHALRMLAQRLKADRAAFARLICAESGKPIKDAETEVNRAITTCEIAAEESTRIRGDYLPLDHSQASTGVYGVVKRVPIGLCSFITPFNFPLNLVMHKIAPAIACGCSFILKPAPQTPLSALRLGNHLRSCGLPDGFFSVLTVPVKDAAPLVEDERIQLLSFTGSSHVGWQLKSRAGKKKVILELGGNAACIVDATADFDHAVERIVYGAFYQSGQSCISVQRLLVHRSIYERMKRAITRKVGQLVIGDPRHSRTFIGPLIAEHEADRLLRWIDEAKRDGARVLCGGKRPRSMKHAERERPLRAFVEPTVLERVPRQSPLWREEVFGPVLTIDPFDRFADALLDANDSRYGLQAGIFTHDLTQVHQAWNELNVGGIVINDVPSFRVDAMPYGGVKDSGCGREGVRYAIEEMTMPRLLVVRTR